MPEHRRFTVWATLAAALTIAPVAAARAGDADQQDFTQIERGRYLSILSDCASCHTVPGSGQPFAGGRPIATPFGNVIASNITPDTETGIGGWTDEEFDNAVRSGLRPDGSGLYPAMPYNAYARMSREDVRAIRAYLATVTPVRNPVVSDQLPFPFNIRAVMRVWNALFFDRGEFKPDHTQSAEWNRGAFLVAGPGHCGACHTPKNALGGDEASEFLQGGLVDGWFAPNITNDRVGGLGAMSIEDVAVLLKTGHNRLTAISDGPMGEVVELSTSQFLDADLRAIATYLKSLPGTGSTDVALPASDQRVLAGQSIYRDACSACHGLDGKGVPSLFPSLAQSPSVRARNPVSAIRVILSGVRSVGTAQEPTAPAMPAYGWQLDDVQVAAVLTYIRNAWGSAAAAVSPDAVRKERSALAESGD